MSSLHSWWKYTPKQLTRQMVAAGGLFALFSIFANVGPWEHLAFLMGGLGLSIGAGASYCLLDDPEEKDIFTLKLAARVGFLLIGPGAGLFMWEYREFGTKDYVWIAGIGTAVPLISIVRLLWVHRKEEP